jgi:hypothetical protein
MMLVIFFPEWNIRAAAITRLTTASTQRESIATDSDIRYGVTVVGRCAEAPILGAYSFFFHTLRACLISTRRLPQTRLMIR